MAVPGFTRLIWPLGCVLFLACAGGRASARATLSDPAHRWPPTLPGTPVPIFSAQGPACASVAIGTVTVEGGRPLPSRETTVAMTRETRRIGGEGIVVLGSSGRLLSGSVIRFTDSTCTR